MVELAWRELANVEGFFFLNDGNLRLYLLFLSPKSNDAGLASMSEFWLLDVFKSVLRVQI